VLQFQGDELEDLDAVVTLENQLIGQLTDAAIVDGHDIGSGETNIFIITTDVEATFQLIKPVLEHADLLRVVVVASRPIGDEEYHVIWPCGFSRGFQVA
jgi:hypothetical protein